MVLSIIWDVSMGFSCYYSKDTLRSYLFPCIAITRKYGSRGQTYAWPELKFRLEYIDESNLISIDIDDQVME